MIRGCWGQLQELHLKIACHGLLALSISLYLLLWNPLCSFFPCHSFFFTQICYLSRPPPLRLPTPAAALSIILLFHIITFKLPGLFSYVICVLRLWLVFFNRSSVLSSILSGRNYMLCTVHVFRIFPFDLWLKFVARITEMSIDVRVQIVCHCHLQLTHSVTHTHSFIVCLNAASFI